MLGILGQGGHRRLFGRWRLRRGAGAWAAAGVDFDDVAFDDDAAGINLDEAARAFDGQFLIGLQDDALGLSVAFVAHGGALVGADDQFIGATDLGGARGFDEQLQAAFDPAVHLAHYLPDEVAAGVKVPMPFDAVGFVLADGLVAVLVDLFVFVVIHTQVAVVPNPFFAVVLYDDVVVFLTMQIDLLFGFFVFKPQFIISGAFVSPGFDGHAGLMLRQAIRRRVGGVIGASGDDRLIRVAL